LAHPGTQSVIKKGRYRDGQIVRILRVPDRDSIAEVAARDGMVKRNRDLPEFPTPSLSLTKIGASPSLIHVA
jgi:hypothetical protein